MKKSFFIWLLFFTIIQTISYQHSSFAQETIRGHVLNRQSAKAVTAAHVINLNKKKLTVTSSTGSFEIVVSIGDTLAFTHINYERKILIVLDYKEINVFMEFSTISLDEINTTNIPQTSIDFKQKLKNMDHIPTEQLIPYGMEPPKPHDPIPPTFQKRKFIDYSIIPDTPPNMLRLASIPLDFFSFRLNKKYRNDSKYYRRQAENKNYIMLDKKYNRELVANLSQLEGDSLIAFIQFMDLDPNYIKRVTEYEIAVYIKEQLKLFLMQTSDSIH